MKPRNFRPVTAIWPTSHCQRTASKFSGIGPGVQLARTALAGDTIRNQAINASAKSAAAPSAKPKAGLSPRTPLHAKESWACVGVDNGMLWVDMFGLGPTWLGHVVLFEMPDSRLSRRDRQALEEAIGRLSESLPGLSRIQRDKTVRLAMDSMQSVRG